VSVGAAGVCDAVSLPMPMAPVPCESARARPLGSTQVCWTALARVTVRVRHSAGLVWQMLSVASLVAHTQALGSLLPPTRHLPGSVQGTRGHACRRRPPSPVAGAPVEAQRQGPEPCPGAGGRRRGPQHGRLARQLVRRPQDRAGCSHGYRAARLPAWRGRRRSAQAALAAPVPALGAPHALRAMPGRRPARRQPTPPCFSH